MKILNKIFPPSGYRSPLLSYPVVLVLLLAELAYVIYHTIGLPLGMDARSYLAAIESVSAGELDYLRTPVYPLILWGLRSVFGAEGLLTANCALNCTALIMSAHFFRRLALKYTGSERATFWTTAAFYLAPSTLYWTAMYMTETLAVVGVIMLLWWSVRDLPGSVSVRAGVMSGLWLAFLVFLRPIFICLLPVLGVYWLLMLRCGGRRAGVVTMLCSVVVVTVAAVAYTSAMNARFGIHSFSGISIPNNYCMVSESCIIGPEHTDNAVLADTIRKIYAEADTIVERPVMLCVHGEPYPCEHFSAAEIEAAINRAIRDNPGRVLLHQLHKLQWQVSLEPMLDHTRLPGLASIERVIFPPMPFYLLFLAAMGVWLVMMWRRGHIAQMTWLMWAICVIMSATSIWGAMSDYARLVLPVMPAAFVMIARSLMPLRYRLREMEGLR